MARRLGQLTLISLPFLPTLLKSGNLKFSIYRHHRQGLYIKPYRSQHSQVLTGVKELNIPENLLLITDNVSNTCMTVSAREAVFKSGSPQSYKDDKFQNYWPK